MWQDMLFGSIHGSIGAGRQRTRHPVPVVSRPPGMGRSCTPGPGCAGLRDRTETCPTHRSMPRTRTRLRRSNGYVGSSLATSRPSTMTVAFTAAQRRSSRTARPEHGRPLPPSAPSGWPQQVRRRSRRASTECVPRRSRSSAALRRTCRAVIRWRVAAAGCHS